MAINNFAAKEWNSKMDNIQILICKTQIIFMQKEYAKINNIQILICKTSGNFHVKGVDTYGY